MWIHLLLLDLHTSEAKSRLTIHVNDPCGFYITKTGELFYNTSPGFVAGTLAATVDSNARFTVVLARAVVMNFIFFLQIVSNPSLHLPFKTAQWAFA